jgi:hypothetical protein
VDPLKNQRIPYRAGVVSAGKDFYLPKSPYLAVREILTAVPGESGVRYGRRGITVPAWDFYSGQWVRFFRSESRDSMSSREMWASRLAEKASQVKEATTEP